MNKIEIDNINSNIDINSNDNYLLVENKSSNFNIKENAVINIFNESDINNSYVFNVYESINFKLNIFDISKDIKRDITINLNGKNSSLELNLSTISLGYNDYNVNIYHNNINTKSISNLHGLSLNNTINFNNNGYIKKGSKNSILEQDNKIILSDKNKSNIKPNLFIDEYDVKASHGAYIGKFKEEDIFYLQTRGLSQKTSHKLLVNGFLLGEFKLEEEYINKLKEIINREVN